MCGRGLLLQSVRENRSMPKRRGGWGSGLSRVPVAQRGRGGCLMAAHVRVRVVASGASGFTSAARGRGRRRWGRGPRQSALAQAKAAARASGRRDTQVQSNWGRGRWRNSGRGRVGSAGQVGHHTLPPPLRTQTAWVCKDQQTAWLDAGNGARQPGICVRRAATTRALNRGATGAVRAGPQVPAPFAFALLLCSTRHQNAPLLISSNQNPAKMMLSSSRALR